MELYDHQKIEKKWQEYWAKNKTFKSSDDSKKPKFYALDMFPYPSGAGLHVGHPEGYTATDIFSRYRRMRGDEVLHPMGWDSFGLPAENYAIKTKIHPAESTAQNIETFRGQIKSLGFSYDWDREISTCSPEYYRWTQWWFLFLYEQGLAYKKKAPVNWCEDCKTVLANEQVENGKCERCKNEVEQKELNQWFFKITDFIEDQTQDSEKKSRVIILHGWGGFPEGNWFPWLAEELKKSGIEAEVPTLPDSENPNWEKWSKALDTLKLDKNTVVVGHSLGGTLITRYLEDRKIKIKKAFLIAAPFTNCNIPEITDITKQPVSEFVRNLSDFEIWGSDNDPYVSQEEAQKYGNVLAKSVKTFPSAEHFMTTDFPELLDQVKTVVTKNITSGLISGLDKIDWPESTKLSQQNWIGKSEGAEVDFEIERNGEIAAEMSLVEDRLENVLLVTWNTVQPEGDSTSSSLNLGIHSRDNEIGTNDPEDKTFVRGEKLIDTKQKAKVILQALQEAELNANEDFGIIEAVATKNHVHALIWISEDIDVAQTVKKLKGVSSRRFYQYFCATSGGMNSTVKEGMKEDDITDDVDNPTIKNEYKRNNVPSSLTQEFIPELGLAPTNQWNDTKNCNRLWREGYHFSRVNTAADLERAYEYLRSHKEKEELAVFLSEAPYKITVFTTRSDTLFGATFMVLAPEHPLVEKITTAEQKSEIEKYIETTKHKSDLDRQAEKEKTGVFTGGYATNPVNNEKIPVWIADYVMMGYGTGAIMAVPAHDDRDFEFAEKYQIPITEVVKPDEKVEGCFAGEGTAINSDFLDGLRTPEAKAKMIDWLEKKKLGTRKTTYKLRDWLVSRQRYWGAPIPIIHCPDCGEVPVPASELPVELPTDVDFMPTGESPLGQSKTFHDVKCPKCGSEKAERENDTMDTFVCSSWYFFRYADPGNEKKFGNTEKMNDWLPVDLYVGGAEHTVLHLLYSRFFTKAAHRAGLIDFDEPFAKLRHQGMILAEDGQKMSKSLGNVINPDEIVQKYGADTLRMYEMFMGPFDQAISWSTTATEGIYKFLHKVWRLYQEKELTECGKEGCKIAPKGLPQMMHKTIKKVTEDIEGFRFNTAISQMMIFINFAQKGESMPRPAAENFCKLLAPFAPHLAEEIWHEILDKKETITYEPWPEYNPDLVVDEMVTYAVQINGKIRGDFEISKDAGKDEVLTAAKEIEKVQKYLAEGEVVKEIFVPGKIVGFVMK